MLYQIVWSKIQIIENTNCWKYELLTLMMIQISYVCNKIKIQVQWDLNLDWKQALYQLLLSIADTIS